MYRINRTPFVGTFFVTTYTMSFELFNDDGFYAGAFAGQWICVVACACFAACIFIFLARKCTKRNAGETEVFVEDPARSEHDFGKPYD